MTGDAAEVVEDVEEATVIATAEAEGVVTVMVEEAAVVDEDETVEEGVVVMAEEDVVAAVVVVEEEESRKDSMSKTRTHSLHCREMFSECIVKGDQGKRMNSSDTRRRSWTLVNNMTLLSKSVQLTLHGENQNHCTRFACPSQNLLWQSTTTNDKTTTVSHISSLLGT